MDINYILILYHRFQIHSLDINLIIHIDNYNIFSFRIKLKWNIYFHNLYYNIHLNNYKQKMNNNFYIWYYQFLFQFHLVHIHIHNMLDHHIALNCNKYIFLHLFWIIHAYIFDIFYFLYIHLIYLYIWYILEIFRDILHNRLVDIYFLE